MRVLSFVLVLSLSFVAPGAIAQSCAKWCVGGDPNGVCDSTPEGAYTAWLNNSGPFGTCGNGSELPRTVQIRSGTLDSGAVTMGYSTPGCDGSPGPYYANNSRSPKAVSRVQAQCECQSSTTAVPLNVTVGYIRNSGDTEGPVVFNPGAPGATACDGSCQVSFGNVVEYWESKARASNGMFRVSYTMETFKTGGVCAGVDDALNPEPSNVPPCAGSLGTVNGQPYCAGTAQNPVSNDKPLPPSPLPSSNGNPTAGTGSGSGTPSVGGGGPEGGPAGAAGVGAGTGNGNGTVNTPAAGTEQQNCGAPGQPKCGIDETGTPGKVADTAYNAKLDGYKTAMDDLRGTAGGSSDKGFFSGWTSFFAAPPIAECVPFQLPSFLNVALGSIDPCAVVGGVRQVMAYIWALLAMWLCVGMVTRTVRGS